MNDRFRPDFAAPFADTIAAAAARQVLLPDVFYGLLPIQARSRAFTASGLAALDQIQSVLDSLTDSLANGTSFAQWQKTVPDAALRLPRHRLELIFRNAMQTAYNIGRTLAQRENKARRPFLMWDAINDSRTRDSHRAMDGYIAPIDAPIWQQWSAPAGHNCRCRRIALTEKQARARGYEEGQLPPPVKPDEGWDYEAADAPNEGLLRAIANRWARCDATLAGEVVGLAKRKHRPAWCDDARFNSVMAQAVELIQNQRMTPSEADQVLQGLLKRAYEAPKDSREAFFEALWKSPDDMQRHIKKRVRDGDVAGLGEYIDRTFDVLARAETLVLSLPFGSEAKASAKVAVAKDGWVVLLTPNGRIVSSYLVDTEASTFERNEIRDGLKIKEYEIGYEYREIIRAIFVGR